MTLKLRERLIDGYYLSGSRLNEVDLAAELGTSRTPVRAALNSLASEGLLQYKPNAGFIVRAFDAEYIAGVYEVRCSLEGLAARLTTERGISDETRGTLYRLVSEADAVTETNPEDHQWAADELVRLNNAFHNAIIDATGNEHLSETLRRTRELPRIEKIKRDAFDFKFIARAQDDHHHILKAIVSGQGARAESLSQEHAHRGAQRMLEYLRELEGRNTLDTPSLPPQDNRPQLAKRAPASAPRRRRPAAHA